MKIQAPGHISATSGTQPARQLEVADFSALVRRYVQQVNTDLKEAGEKGVALATGKNQNISETMLAMKEAELSFQLMLSVRNKLVEAYKEIMRMQV